MLYMKYLGKTAATETVKRLFSNSPNSDVISIDEVFVAAGRGELSQERNMAWLSNKLTHLKYNGLVKALYTYDGRKKLDRLQLTLEGKKALGRVDAGSPTGQNEERPHALDNIVVGGSASLEDVANAVQSFQDQNPKYEVIFEVKLRKGSLVTS